LIVWERACGPRRPRPAERGRGTRSRKNTTARLADPWVETAANRLETARLEAETDEKFETRDEIRSSRRGCPPPLPPPPPHPADAPGEEDEGRDELRTRGAGGRPVFFEQLTEDSSRRHMGARRRTGSGPHAKVEKRGRHRIEDDVAKPAAPISRGEIRKSRGAPRQGTRSARRRGHTARFRRRRESVLVERAAVPFIFHCLAGAVSARAPRLRRGPLPSAACRTRKRRGGAPRPGRHTARASEGPARRLAAPAPFPKRWMRHGREVMLANRRLYKRHQRAVAVGLRRRLGGNSRQGARTPSGTRANAN